MDFGLLFYNRLEMQNAAQAGAHWAIANGLYNTGNIAVAGENATKIAPSQITITSTEFCGCPSTTGVTLQNTNPPPDPCASPTPAPSICSGGATCSGGALAGNYVSVCAKPTTAYKSFIAFGGARVLGLQWIGVSDTPNVTATSTVRIQ
jgi:Flp pilus assembly protein TadG